MTAAYTPKRAIPKKMTPKKRAGGSQRGLRTQVVLQSMTPTIRRRAKTRVRATSQRVLKVNLSSITVLHLRVGWSFLFEGVLVYTGP